MSKTLWERHLVELIRRTSTDLPADVETALKRAMRQDSKTPSAKWVLNSMLENVALARRNSTPLCQDTGTMIFTCRVPVGFDTNALAARIRAAISRATRLGYLRENTIDPISGRPFKTNVAPGAPVLHFEQGARKTVDIRLMLKGGGCENVGAQYALPDERLGAGRDLEGARRCIMDAVWQAQGKGCSPGILGVCIGGDCATGAMHAKEQFLRKLGDRSPLKVLAALEARVLRDAATLGIGPMGLGGTTTLLDVKVGTLSRLPASFFVTVAYMCWSFRRRGAVFGVEGGLQRRLY